MELKKEVENGIAVICPDGRLDTATSPAFEKELQMLLSEGLDVQLDCSKLYYVSSAGLRVFLTTYKKAAENGRRFWLCKLKREVREVIDMVGFSQVLEIE